MSEPLYLLPEDRAVITIEGPDVRPFLQGIISNDVEKVGPDRAIWAAFLTAQGKYLFDFFIAQVGDALCLDCETARRDELVKRLGRYKLRSKVELRADDDRAVALGFGEGALEALGLKPDAGAAKAAGAGAAFVDPRLAEAGARAVLPRAEAVRLFEDAGFAPGSADSYHAMRLSLGLPDGSRDLEIEKATLLESNFDKLNGVDFQKGCYMGQEVTARTHYRGLIKKRLLPVDIDGPAPPPGTPVMRGDKEAGTMRSATNGLGLALLRLEHVDAAAEEERPMIAGEARLTPHRPHWLRD